MAGRAIYKFEIRQSKEKLDNEFIFKKSKDGGEYTLIRKRDRIPLWVNGGCYDNKGHFTLNKIYYNIQGIMYCNIHNCHYPKGVSNYKYDHFTFNPKDLEDPSSITLKDGTPWNEIKYNIETDTTTPSLSQPKVDVEEELSLDLEEETVSMRCGFNADGTRFMVYNYVSDKDKSALKDLVKDAYKELCKCE